MHKPLICTITLAGLLFAGAWAFAPSNALADSTRVIKGQCASESHIAEGAIGEDLTKRRSRFFCDTAVITGFSDTPKHLMVQFAESGSTHARLIGYAGMMDSAETMSVSSVYLESGHPTPVTDGACKFFFKERRMISGIACGAKIDEDGRRTVPIVEFKADSSSTAELPSFSTAAQDLGVPYDRAGIANCSLPGTTIEFALDGHGGARVTRIESNYAPFRNAARQTRIWRANLVEREGARTLVLDNGHRTRIMVDLPDGRGMAFSAEGGVSDILCQVLVSP